MHEGGYQSDEGEGACCGVEEVVAVPAGVEPGEEGVEADGEEDGAEELDVGVVGEVPGPALATEVGEEEHGTANGCGEEEDEDGDVARRGRRGLQGGHGEDGGAARPEHEGG